MTRRAAVLGSPIEHSLSPIIHNFAYELLNFEANYQAVEVKSDQLLEFLTGELKTEDLLGFSLTMPLKEELTRLKTSIIQVDERSKQISSANTIYKSNSGWQATSTDVEGFHFLLKDKSFQSVSILGAGGTARAALAALGKNKSKIYIFRRDSKRDVALNQAGKGIDFELRDWSSHAECWGSELVINTIPSSQVSSIACSFISPEILLDATYSPWPPELSKLQLLSGRTLISGLELLAAQAVGQIALMTGLEIDNLWLYKQLITKLDGVQS